MEKQLFSSSRTPNGTYRRPAWGRSSSVNVFSGWWAETCRAPPLPASHRAATAAHQCCRLFKTGPEYQKTAQSARPRGNYIIIIIIIKGMNTEEPEWRVKVKSLVHLSAKIKKEQNQGKEQKVIQHFLQTIQQPQIFKRYSRFTNKNKRTDDVNLAIQHRKQPPYWEG